MLSFHRFIISPEQVLVNCNTACSPNCCVYMLRCLSILFVSLSAEVNLRVTRQIYCSTAPDYRAIFIWEETTATHSSHAKPWAHKKLCRVGLCSGSLCKAPLIQGDLLIHPGHQKKIYISYAVPHCSVEEHNPTAVATKPHQTHGCGWKSIPMIQRDSHSHLRTG